MAWLIAATLLMIASHALPSAPGPRQRLIRTLGRPGFHVAYSLISLLTLGLLIWAYQAVGPQPWLYAPSRAARVIAPVAMFVATFLITARLTTPTTSDRAYGIYRVTVVPGSLGVLLWTVVHLLNLGDARAVIVFGGFALIALFALIKNLVGAGAQRREVGWVPFVAIARGRQAWVWREIGWWRLALALVVYGSLIYLHPIVIGRDSLSGFR
jgi:uncharacterized membrane protein